VSPALRTPGVLAIAIVIVLASGCTGAAQPAPRTGPSIGAFATPSATPGQTSATKFAEPWTTAQPPADCPATRSTPDVRPSPPVNPDALLPAARPVPWVQDWYGNDALWVGLPPTGVLPADPQPQGLSTKFPWWRALPGRLTIQAQRLDGPTGAFTADVPAGYGDLGFQPTGLNWAVPGCWRVTGTVHNKSLTFTVWVQQF
jgi:hypothetical protein